MEQYLLRDKDTGNYWIWFKPSPTEKPQVNGPHGDKPLNLDVIEVDNPLAFQPPTPRTAP